MVPDEKVTARWSELGEMDRIALRVAWTKAFGDAPPNFLSMIFMRKALIWHTQCGLFGGPSSNSRKGLKLTVGGKLVDTRSTQLKAGTRLVREWNGRRYQVDVLEDGFGMNEEHFRSLSAIALRITGTRWSGPRFFGLTSSAGAPR